MNPEFWARFEANGRPLREYQKRDLVRFYHQNEMALFWEMGTGKTTEAISWLRIKYGQAKEVSPTLIVSPVATLYNWANEFKLNSPEKVWSEVFVPYMRTKRTKYTNAERVKLLETVPQKIWIINPESFDNGELVAALRKRGFKNLIVDESQRFKGFKSKRFNNLLTVSDFIPNRAILTGTPILNTYLDIWAQFRILDQGKTFGRNFFVFREQYFEDKNASWKGKPKYFPDFQPKPSTATDIAVKLETKSSRKRKEECLDLPPLVEVTHTVEMGKEQAKAYREMEEHLIAEVKSGVCSASNALAQVNRMLQILSGHLPVEFLTSPEKHVVHFKENPRLDALAELLTELTPEHKVIVWTTYQASYEEIRKLLSGLKLEWAEIVGQTKDRQGELDRFQNDPKCRVMMSNPQAGGVGVNMIAASYAIYFSRSYSLGDRLQSEARNHRGGSEIHEKITLIDLVAKDTLDEIVLASLQRKENFSDIVLDRIKSQC